VPINAVQNYYCHGLFQIPICDKCINNLQKQQQLQQEKKIPSSSEVDAPEVRPDPYADLPPLHTVRYWMSMLATLLCLQALVFCLVCLSPESVRGMASSPSQILALELTARKTLLDVGVLTIVVRSFSSV
jgi:hypothetical protein